MSAELSSAAAIAAVAAELSADDADDFYRQLYDRGEPPPPTPAAVAAVFEDDLYRRTVTRADADRRDKEEKLLRLQMEIERRRQQLIEMSYGTGSPAGYGNQFPQQQPSPRQRRGEPDVVSGPGGMAADWQQRNFGGIAAAERYKYQTLPARTSYSPASGPHQQMTSPGVIKPIDYQVYKLYYSVPKKRVS